MPERPLSRLFPGRFRGALGVLVTTLLVAMSLFHLYAAVAIVPTLTLRPVHVGFVLLLAFLVFPATPRLRLITLAKSKRMLSAANSMARARVSASMPPLLAA